ncbi:MAG: hypothetical protein WBH51_01445 [Mycolicibacter algericus]|uniref:hypothetical protein n=1 Tax=Mycolicibacter algericus TaxID=1288388 RepID=UPI003C72D23A
MKTVYHYTCLAHLDDILTAGKLTTTEPNLQPARGGGPRVVWLTTDPDCKYGHGLQAELTETAALVRGITLTEGMREQWDKTRIRFTIRLPNGHVHRWRQWALDHNADPMATRQLVRAAAGGANTWRVVEHPILCDRWLEVLDRQTGEQLWVPVGRRDIA